MIDPHIITKGRDEAIVVIEGVNKAIETIHMIDTETGTENTVMKEMAKEPTAVTDKMVQMDDMVTGIVIATGTVMTIMNAGAREETIMKDLNVVTTIKSKEKNQKFLMIFRHPHYHYRLVYPRRPHLMVVLIRLICLIEEMERSTMIHQEVGVMVAIMPMMMI